MLGSEIFEKMKILKALAITIGVSGILASSASTIQAIQLADGTVYFDKSPRLIKAFPTYNTVNVRGPRYYFTFSLPDNAGLPLEKVTIQQRQGPEYIRFLTDKTSAFEGTYTNKGEMLNVRETIEDEATKETTVIFDPPIPPGTDFTVGLKPTRNPKHPDVYIYGVRAFPQGEKSYGSKIGFGRFQIYQDRDDAR